MRRFESTMPNLERLGYRIESYIVKILTKLD